MIGHWHNETINILSHWLGALLVGVLALITYPILHHKHITSDWRDAVGFYVFFASAAFCLVCSGTFHCLTCHSLPVAKQWHAMDYTGIVGELI